MDKKQTYHHRERQLHKDKEIRLSTKYKITQKKNNGTTNKKKNYT